MKTTRRYPKEVRERGPYAWSSPTARSTSLNGPQCALSPPSYDNALAESVIGLYKTELI